MKCGRFLALIVWFTTYMVFGQTDPLHEREVERIADELFALQENDLNYSELYENLLQLRSHPLDLNSASADQLRSLFVLSESQIGGILDYRERAGRLLSIYELQNVPGLDPITISRLEPFVMVSESSLAEKNLFHRITDFNNSYLILRHQRTIELRKGFRSISNQPAAFRGSPDNIYMRFRTSKANDHSIGFTAEKDAGEAIDWNPESQRFGLDYYSLHFQLVNKGRLNNLILGDFQAQFGQGLLLGGAFGVGKGGETIATTRRSNLGFLPYTSLDENNFFRGVAVTLRLSRYWRLSSFISHKRMDGSTQVDSLGNVIEISSFNQTGLHRTETELANRKSLTENNAAAVLEYQRNTFHSGIVVHANHFSLPVNSNPTLYNQFSFKGAELVNTSAYLNYSWHNFSFFSEIAKSLDKGFAGVAGMLASLSHSMDLSMVYRNYARDFQSYYGNAFGENSRPQNESGLYLGWKYRVGRDHHLSGYTDLFRFNWLRYRVYSPSNGFEWLARYTYQPTKQVAFYVQVREENKARNLPESVTYQTANGRKRNYWINIDYSVNDHLGFRTRVQQSSYSLAGTTTRGFTIIQDATVNFKRMSVSTRYALFDTDDYENRQYVYERDVWLAYSIPAYYGVGVRSYVLIRYRFNSRLDAWFRWARTSLLNQDHIGSGNEAIEGNHRNDLKFQIRYKL